MHLSAPYIGRLTSSPQANQFVQYRKEKVKFINTLMEDLRGDFWYRPFLISKGVFLDKEYVEEKVSGINILYKQLNKEMLDCKLIVMDNPSTSLNVALASNIPTICYWDENSFPISRQAQPYFNKFKKLGLLFNDGASAAQKDK